MALQVLAVHELEGQRHASLPGSPAGQHRLRTLPSNAPRTGTNDHQSQDPENDTQGAGWRGRCRASFENLRNSFRHHNTHGVHTPVSRSHPAMTIPPEPGQGVHPAGLQRIAQDITLFAHGQGFGRGGGSFQALSPPRPPGQRKDGTLILVTNLDGMTGSRTTRAQSLSSLLFRPCPRLTPGRSSP